MNKLIKLSAFAIVVIMTLCVFVNVSDDSNADIKTEEVTLNNGDDLVQALSNEYTENTEVNITLGEGSYSLNNTSSTVFKGKSLTIQASNGSHVVINLNKTGSDNPDLGTAVTTGETSLILRNLNICSESGMVKLDIWNFYHNTIEDCEFKNVLLFRQSSSDPDNTQKGTFTVKGCTFSNNTAGSTSYAATIVASSIVFTDNTISGHGRGPNLVIREGDGTILIRGNEVSGLTHSKPISFQICGDVGNRQAMFSDNIIDDGIGLSLYHDLSVRGEGRVILLGNEFNNCNSDVFYAMNDSTSPQYKFSTKLYLASNEFIHNGSSAEPILSKEVDENGPIGEIGETDLKTVKSSIDETRYGWYSAGGTMTVSTENELKELATLVNSGVDFAGETVKLGANINLTEGWTPIGNSLRTGEYKDGTKAFSGTFDGDGHTISNLINDGYVPGGGSLDGKEYLFGLFGYTYNATITNLILEDVHIDTATGNEYVGDSVAALVGYGLGTLTISDVKVVSGSVKANDAVAGVVGRFYGTVLSMTGCSNGASVEAAGDNAKAGGITSITSLNCNKITIKRCSNTGNIIGSNSAGIIGYTAGNSGTSYSITSCNNSGDVTGSYSGGIIGYDSTMDKTITIADCHNTGIINSTIDAGGLIGLMQSKSEITSSDNSGNITGRIAGGIVGSFNGSYDYRSALVMEDCSIHGNLTVSGTDITAVLLGSASGYSVQITSCTVDDSLTVTTVNENVTSNNNTGYQGTVRGLAIGNASDINVELSDIQENHELELIASVYFNKGMTVTLVGCTTSTPMTWCGNSDTLDIKLIDSKISGLELYRNNFRISATGSSIGTLTAGPSIMDSGIQGWTPSGENSKSCNPVVTILGNTTLSVGQYQEIADSNKKYNGKVIGTDETSVLLVTEGDGAGNYTWDTNIKTWKSVFVVTFDSNYEGGGVTYQTIDDSATLKTNTFEREGYAFLGWNTEADGSGTEYADGAQFTVLQGSSGITLYAQWKDPVAIVDGKYCQTLGEAIDSISDEDTVKLLDDVTESITILSGKKITIDLNGHDITNTPGQHTITVASEATLTIIGKGTVDNVSHQKAAVWNAGTATLNGGDYTRSEETGKTSDDSGDNSFYNIVNHGNMTINGGVSVTQNGHFSSMIENGWYDGKDNTGKEDSTMTINGGEFSGGLNTVKNDDYGVLTINGGFFINNSQAAILNWNKTTVKAGTFTVTDGAEAVILNGYLNNTMDCGQLVISGGDFNGPVGFGKMSSGTELGSVEISGGDFTSTTKTFGTVGSNPEISISGGSFKSDITEYCEPGFAPTMDSDGNYVVDVNENALGIAVDMIFGHMVEGGASMTYDIEYDSGLNITWSIDKTDVAKVEGGVITFLGEGEATITASATLSNGVTDTKTIAVSVAKVPAVEGIVFETVTSEDMGDTTLEKMKEMIQEFEKGAMFGITSPSGDESFTIPYEAFETFGWTVTSDNYTDYEFTVLHVLEDGGYELPKIVASEDGLTVTVDSYSPFYFLCKLADMEVEPDHPHIPSPDDDDEPIPLPPATTHGGSGADSTTVIAACAAAAVVAILAILLVSTYRRK